MAKGKGEAAAGPNPAPELTLHDIVEARALDGYRLWVRFDDGVETVADVSGLVGHGVFEAWRDPEFFGRVYVDPELGTVAWPGGLDLAPDALYDLATRGRALPHQQGGAA